MEEADLREEPVKTRDSKEYLGKLQYKVTDKMQKAVAWNQGILLLQVSCGLWDYLRLRQERGQTNCQFFWSVWSRECAPRGNDTPSRSGLHNGACASDRPLCHLAVLLFLAWAHPYPPTNLRETYRNNYHTTWINVAYWLPSVLAGLRLQHADAERNGDSMRRVTRLGYGWHFRSVH